MAMPPVAPPRGLMPSMGAGAPSPVAGGADPMNDGEIAGPEEQALYDTFVSMGAMGLYDPEAMPDVVAMLRDSEDRLEGIAEVATAVTMRVLQAARAKGRKVGGDVLMHGGKEITELVVELAERGGGELSEEEAERAFFLAVDKFRAMADSAGIHEEEDDAPLAGPATTPAPAAPRGGLMPGGLA